MSLSPEPGLIVVDTPPDSPLGWHEDSDTSNSPNKLEQAPASPMKRVRQLYSRRCSKRGKFADTFPSRHPQTIDSSPRDTLQVDLDGTEPLGEVEQSISTSEELPGDDVGHRALACYVAAVEADRVQIYPLGSSRKLFVVQGWDAKGLCAKVCRFYSYVV